MNLAVTVVVAMFVAAAGLMLSGLYLLAGLAWTMIAAGAFLFGAGVVLRAGLKHVQ